VFTAQSLYGSTPQAPSYGIAAPTQAMATDDIRAGWRGLVDPNNPLAWFGAILLLTTIAGVGASIRLGKARAGVAVNQT
jgi:hypothetical protein